MAVLELPPEDGEHIGRYRAIKVIACGGMGEVLLAWDPDLNRSVAIKRIRHDSNAPLLRQRLLQEAFAVGSLHHPAIVTVYDLLKYEGDDCIVMEYVPGQTLAEALKRGPLEPALAVRLAKRVASGLAAAHEAGFIHRDLKTENVMVTPTEEAKILDFGVAKPMGITAGDPSLTLAGSVVGTCRAMSPEQARGAEVDERSDLFSLGVLLYETLTGISPFQGSNAPETLNKVISERPPCVDTLRPGLPPRLVALLVRLLAKEPAGRPQSAAEVARELEAIAASLGPAGDPEETVSVLPTDAVKRWRGDATPAISPPATPAPGPERAPRPSRRWRLMIAILSSLVVLVAAGVFYHRYWARAHTKLLRIVVLRPEVGDDPRLQLAALGLLNAGLNTLRSLRDIAAVDPLEIQGSPRTSKEIALAAAADEVLIIGLEKESSSNLGLITLRCVRRSDGRDLWTDKFEASLDPQELLSLGQNLNSRLMAHFSGYSPMTRSLPLEVRKEDYAAFLDIQQRIQKGQTSLEPELRRLQAIVDRSPNFLDAQLLAAEVAINIYQSKRDPALSMRAHNFVQQAERSAPDNPRLLQTKFRLVLSDGQPAAAAKILSQLEDLKPDHAQDSMLQANLATAQGDLETARIYQEEAVDSAPSWTNLLGLADLEEKLGRVQEARRDLERVINDSPENIVAWQRLAELELYFGDPNKAEKIYRHLLASFTERAENLRLRANLGAALVLQQRYKDAAEILNSALNIDPDDIEINLNLADVEDELGDKDSALNLYAKIHKKLTANHLESADASYEMIEAQCLAHLGFKSNAGDIAYKTLSQNPDDVTLLPVAAMVFMLADDPRAPNYVRVAIRKGIQPCWFKLPPFAPLFRDPNFQQSLGGATR